jgi:hypothetical protein
LKSNQVFVIPALLAALLLSACGEKAAEPEAVPAEATPATESAVEPAQPAVQAGGYEPTAEEHVPGITRTKEEQDKINTEAMAGTPMPIIPGEAAAAEPAPDADAETAPEVAPAPVAK